jgi:hypothetical protein
MCRFRAYFTFRLQLTSFIRLPLVSSKLCQRCLCDIL